MGLERGASNAASGRIDESPECWKTVAERGSPCRSEDGGERRTCREQPACRDALTAIERNREPKATSTVAFKLAAPRLLPEGLAHDAASDSFFVSSVRQRLILRVDRSRQLHPFADRRAGLWAALG